MAVIGGDQRKYYSNNTSFPWRAHVWLNCTGVFISPRHILTAAHCVADRKGYYSAYTKKTNEWAPGVDGGKLPPWSVYPYKAPNPSPNPYPAYGARLQGCLKPTVTKSWFNKKKNGIKYDYAVLEETCGYKPGRVVGYLGFGGLSYDTLHDIYWYGVGYPAVDMPSGAVYPQLWGNHPKGFHDVNTYTLEYRMDTSEGQSGMPLIRKKNGKFKVFAVHRGWDSNWYGTKYNHARRMTKGMTNWVKSHIWY